MTSDQPADDASALELCHGYMPPAATLPPWLLAALEREEQGGPPLSLDESAALEACLCEARWLAREARARYCEQTGLRVEAEPPELPLGL